MEPLLQTQVAVDNINWQRFNDFGIRADPRLSIRPSNLGGTGLFFHSDCVVEDLVVARIPHAITFDLKSLMGRLETLKTVNPRGAAVVKSVLSFCKGNGETEIIVDFMFSFMIILTNKEYASECPVEEIEFYLEILSQTDLGSLDLKDSLTKDSKIDYLFLTEKNKMHTLKEKHEAIVDFLGKEGTGMVVPTFEEYYHIYKVIKSRVLEIPQAAGGEGEEEGDFVVNTTLVPLLDFANHQENNNAYFDIDKSTNEVILKYSGSGLNEVCISYSDISSVQQFVSTYGFVPEAKVQVFELKVNKYEINEFINEIQSTVDVRYDLIMKWLEILPTIQFVITPDKIGLNYQFNPIPFWYIFTQKYKYLGLPEKLDSSLVNDADILTAGVSAESIKHIIEFQEERCDVMQGIEKVAIQPNEIDDVNIMEAIAKFNKFVKSVCKYRDVTKVTGLTGDYLRFKYKMFKRILEQEDDFKVEIDPRWNEISYPINVIYNYL